MRLLYPLAKRFIAGHSFDSAKPKIDKLIKDGYEVSVDYLGEHSESVEDCERAKDQYIEIINLYKNQNIDLSIKQSQLIIIHGFKTWKPVLNPSYYQKRNVSFIGHFDPKI